MAAGASTKLGEAPTCHRSKWRMLERGVTSFSCEQTAAPYQEERKLMVSPLVGWAALALLYRLWPVGVVVGLGIAALVVWRVQARGRRG